MMDSRVSNDISIFTRTEGLLKIKDQADETTHEDVGPNKHHMKSPIVTLE
jgi:hypothetical protein